MKPDTLNIWTAEEDAKLTALRRAGVRWLDIPKSMPGRTIHACQQRLFNLKLKAQDKKKVSGGAARKRTREKTKAAGAVRREKIARQALAYAAAKAELFAAEARAAELRRAATEAARPPSARRLSTHVLIADAELRSRIARHGPNGLLGDPEPGRSALDKRNAEAHA